MKAVISTEVDYFSDQFSMVFDPDKKRIEISSSRYNQIVIETKTPIKSYGVFQIKKKENTTGEEDDQDGLVVLCLEDSVLHLKHTCDGVYQPPFLRCNLPVGTTINVSNEQGNHCHEITV